MWDPSANGTRNRLVIDLVERLVAFLAEHTPTEACRGTRGADAVLARVCVVLTD